MIQEKEYFAFISYQREDEKWAKWLANELENYHLPTTLNGKDLPKNLRPIFRDVDELSAGNLPEQIYHALSISKNLIVVCSPRSAKSEWVDKEIESFIKIKGGKADNIYPFIIEGVPFSKVTATECFPETLRELPENEERLGGNINEQGGRNAAVVKIIAGMLGVGFDALWQKYEREKRRRRNMTLISFFLFAIVALGVSLWLWHLNNQVTVTNRKLVRENICINSREVLTLLEKGNYVDAQHQVQSILDFWNKAYHQDIPEMEKALRALYRYQYRDGIVKLYSLPLSDKQQFLSADSDYLYIRDTNEGNDRIVSYAIGTGDSARQIFPREGKKTIFPIYDCHNGIVICKSMKRYYLDNGVNRALPDTICVYDLNSGKKRMERKGYFNAIILNKENVLLQQYDTLSRRIFLEVAQTNNGQVIQKWLSPCESFFHAASLVNDSLIVIGDRRTFLYHVKSGEKLCEIDYGKEMKEIDNLSVNNSMINKSLKEFVIGSHFGLKRFSVKKHNMHILDKSDKYGPTAFNPSGTMLAAVKYGHENRKEKDSILVYISGLQFPLFSIEGNGFGYITFADENIFVEGYSSQNRINVYSCVASFDSRELYSQTGRYYAWLDRNNGDSIVIFNDSTEETIDVIRKSKNRISWVYGFSPQDTYLLYSTTKDPLIVHHIHNKKDITIPISWDEIRYNRFNCFISDNERKLLKVIHSGIDDVITLYDIRKNFKEIFNVRVTQDKYHVICSALSANGSRMALTEGSKIYIYKTDSFPEDTTSIDIRHIDNSSVRNLCFSKGESRLLAASYSDGTIRFWDTMTGEQIYSTIYSEANDLISLDISSDAQYLIGTNMSSHDSWEYLIWHIPSGILIDKETNAWSWWANFIIPNRMRLKPDYQACFARNSNEIIVNEHNLLGLSRKFYFPSFDELLKLYLNK